MRDKKTKALIFILSFAVIFIIYTIAFYSFKGWQWDNLFPYVLDWAKIVGGTSGVLGLADIIGKAFGHNQSEYSEVNQQDPEPIVSNEIIFEPQVEEIGSGPVVQEKRRRIMACKGGKKRKK